MKIQPQQLFKSVDIVPVPRLPPKAQQHQRRLPSEARRCAAASHRHAKTTGRRQLWTRPGPANPNLRLPNALQPPSAPGVQAPAGRQQLSCPRTAPQDSDVPPQKRSLSGWPLATAPAPWWVSKSLLPFRIRDRKIVLRDCAFVKLVCDSIF